VSKSLRILLVVLGVVILLVGSVHAWFYLGGWVWPPSPEKLAEQALNGATVVERAEAAILLADCGYTAVEQLRRVLRESDTPEVRAACINGLGLVRDYESMDLFVELLEDESLVVRSSAGSVVPGMITGHVPKFTYLADDPVETRQKAIESLRQAWEELRDSPLLNRYKRLLQEMRSR
jgi:HEAT repeat protein